MFLSKVIFFLYIEFMDIEYLSWGKYNIKHDIVYKLSQQTALAGD